MDTEEALTRKRFAELAQRADRTGRFCYTSFLCLAEQDILARMRSELGGVRTELFGGAEGCERVMVRFGEGENEDPDAAFPIRLLRAEPTGMKFADKLTHRDILGALMGLGIERSETGDIVIRDNIAHIFVSERMADYIRENLTDAKHTSLKVSREDELPEGELFRIAPAVLTVASPRLDCVAAAFLKLSRAEMQELVSKGLVFINGRRIQDGSVKLADGAVVSVRTKGRFLYYGAERKTKKGRLAVRIGRYE